MKISLICFSLTGQETGEKLCQGLKKAGMTAELDRKSKYLPDSIQISTSAWAGEKFPVSDALHLYRRHRDRSPQYCAIRGIKEIRPCSPGDR